MPLGLRIGPIWGLLKELRISAADEGPLVVEGPPALAEALRRELGRDARPGAVRGGSPEGGQAFVLVVAGPLGAGEEELLKTAHRHGVPAVVVLAGPGLEPRVPFVLATDVVEARPGQGFPVDEIARALAARLGERGAPLAGRVPVLRDAVADRLIDYFSKRGGLVGAAVFLPGADYPVITLHQFRMVLRLGQAHGVEIGRERAPELLGVVAGGYAFRGIARNALRYVPVAGFAVRAAVAYTGTRAIGEAAVRYFQAIADGDTQARG